LYVGFLVHGGGGGVGVDVDVGGGDQPLDLHNIHIRFKRVRWASGVSMSRRVRRVSRVSSVRRVNFTLLLIKSSTSGSFEKLTPSSELTKNDFLMLS
jgi:hypothetical protein